MKTWVCTKRFRGIQTFLVEAPTFADAQRLLDGEELDEAQIDSLGFDVTWHGKSVVVREDGAVSKARKNAIANAIGAGWVNDDGATTGDSSHG